MNTFTKYIATVARFVNNNDRATKYRENRFTKFDPRDLHLMTWLRGDFAN